MLEEVKDTKLIVAVEASAKPMFSCEFMNMMQEQAYEALRKRLQELKEDCAVELLDHMMILILNQSKAQYTWIDNQFVSEAIGGISHCVPALGGGFFLSSEMTSTYKPA